MNKCIGSGSTSVRNDAPAEVIRDYTLVLDDSFTNGIDPSVWSSELLWGRNLTINNEEQYYVDALGGDTSYPSPFVTNPDGSLGIVATPIEGAKPVTQFGIEGGQNYTSGVLHTRDVLCFSEGYVEVCAKMPPATTDGAWVATWLLNCFYYNGAFQKNNQELDGVGNDKFNPEIDFMEAVYGPGYQGPLCVKNAYHYYTGDRTTPDNYSRWSIDGSNFKQFNGATGAFIDQFNVYPDCDGANQFTFPDTCLADYSADFHTYAVDWRRDYIKFYVDGELRNCITDTTNLVTDQLMYFIMNFAVGGAFPFGPVGGANYRLADPNQYPASFDISYVRIYLAPGQTPR